MGLLTHISRLSISKMDYCYFTFVLLLMIGQGICQHMTINNNNLVNNPFVDEFGRLSSITTCDNDTEAYALIANKYSSTLWSCLGLEWAIMNGVGDVVYVGVYIGPENLRDALESTCRGFDDVFVECVANVTTACDDARQATIDVWLNEFRDRICEPSTYNIAPKIEKYVTYLEQLETKEASHKLKKMSRSVGENCQHVLIPPKPDEVADVPDYMSKFAERILRCFRVAMSYVDADDDIRGLFLYFYYLQMPPGTIVDQRLIFTKIATVPRGERRSSVKVFGDPHCYVHMQGYVTCGAKGETLFLKNGLVTIMGNNTAASPESEATYMTHVNITFRSSTGDTAQYITEASSLPHEFYGGGQTKFAGSPDVITLTQIHDDMIRFVYNASGLAITLSKNSFRDIYMLVVRAANNLFDESTGLLIDGCPDEIYIEEPASRRTRDTVCSNVADELRQFCRFDYSVTGDKRLAESVNELLVLDEKAEELDVQLGGMLTTVPPRESTTKPIQGTSMQNEADLLHHCGTIWILVSALVTKYNFITQI